MLMSQMVGSVKTFGKPTITKRFRYLKWRVGILNLYDFRPCWGWVCPVSISRTPCFAAWKLSGLQDLRAYRYHLAESISGRFERRMEGGSRFGGREMADGWGMDFFFFGRMVG